MKFLRFFLLVLSLGSVAAHAETYAQMRAKIQAKRDELRMEYGAAKTSAERVRVLGRAKSVMFSELVNRLFPAWYGTTWDFNGTSETPRVGKVACGYFVSTTLRDLGLNLNRFRIAQLYSHDIVKRLSSEPQTHSSVAETLKVITQSRAPSLWVVGLDQHVGFLVRDASQKIHFVHSSYGSPAEVVSELAAESAVLAQSTKFVLGALSDSDEFVVKWLEKTRI